ncbi:MAG TPA: DNA-processing protein DprA [Trebonia sp.]
MDSLGIYRTAAHTTALAGGGRTVAVIGTGIDRVYPAQNAALQEEIAMKGLVISQFLPGALPTKTSFPMRNAVMSGYALATVVIEAAYQSGARMQARAMALQVRCRPERAFPSDNAAGRGSLAFPWPA